MKAARALGATNLAIAEALGGAVSIARVSQVVNSADPRRDHPEDQVRQIVADVAAETGLAPCAITATDHLGDFAIARRIVCLRAQARGISYASIGRALGITQQSAGKMVRRHKALWAAAPADLVAPFRRGAGHVPLTVSDYCTRARVSEELARDILDELRVRRIVRAEKVVRLANERIFDLIVPAQEGDAA